MLSLSVAVKTIAEDATDWDLPNFLFSIVIKKVNRKKVRLQKCVEEFSVSETSFGVMI